MGLLLIVELPAEFCRLHIQLLGVIGYVVIAYLSTVNIQRSIQHIEAAQEVAHLAASELIVAVGKHGA